MTHPDIFSAQDSLPSPLHFPTNIREKAKSFVDQEFAASKRFMIVTGYSSLEYMITFFNQVDLDAKEQLCVVLGNEPLYRELQKKYRIDNLRQEITDFWLQQNIAAYLCWPVIQLMENIKAGKIQFRLLDKLHAKLYVGDASAMLGSSNFSMSGLVHQFEANVRVTQAEQPAQYEAIAAIARYYFDKGLEANDFMLELLQRLLRLVTWKEAVARAVGELLEGDFVRNDPRVAELFGNLEPKLWRVQEEAIGQALYVLDHFGSVLIADPTGSGKTRLGAALQLCLKNRVLLGGGKIHEDNTMLICPPQVLENWREEFVKMGTSFNNVESQAKLSRTDEHDPLFHRLSNARIILLDEAHNYLSAKSNRSERLQNNLADHMLLLTATPINRRFEDMFRLIEIMGIDNLDEAAVNDYLRLYKLAKKGDRIGPKDKEKLQGYLSQFLIRRTKRELNRRVEETPDAHRLPSGRLCRYPQQIPDVYSLHETKDDIALAKEINALADQLKGLIRLRRLILKPEERVNPETESKRLQLRLTAAKALAVYAVQATMRSSNAALIDHIEGTKSACNYLDVIELPLGGLEEDKNTGNMIGKLESYKNKLPEHNLSIDLPPWLSDPDAYREACEEEIRLYKAIAQCARKMSLGREIAKARFLAGLLKKHDLVLSFDRNIITLNVLDQIIRREHPEAKPLLVTAREKNNQFKLREHFALGSAAKGWIGLCSEVMSEGVNLQQASAVVLLDVPGVMRIAEQRIGRIDRMNSPHDRVEVYFPDDHPEFALKTDRKFFLTAQIVDDMIGGNVDLPDEMLEKWKVEVISGREIATNYQEAHERAAESFADGIQDAFQKVRALVQGPQALVEEQVYEAIRKSKATLGSSVAQTEASFVAAKANWGFFCLRSTPLYSSTWVFLEEKPTQKLIRGNDDFLITTALPEICDLLREKLAGCTDITDYDALVKVQKLTERLFRQLHDFEKQNLPNKKRRAIQLLSDVVDYYLTTSKADQARRRTLEAIKRVLAGNHQDGHTIDYYRLANRWIRVVQPFIVQEKKRQPKAAFTVHLGTMLRVFKHHELPTEVFERLLAEVTYMEPVEKRVAAYVVGYAL